MKILHVYKDFDPPVHGGMERHMALTCRYQREWAEVSALTCSRSLFSRHTMRDEIPVHEVGEWFRFQSAPASPLFPWHMHRTEADVVVVHVPNPTAELGWLLGRPKAKLVVRYQSDVVRQAAAMKMYKPFLMKFLDKADMILPSSQQYLDTSETLAPFKEKCRVVPLGIVPSEFATPDSAHTAALQEKYPTPFVLFAGRHRYYKGLENLVKAAPGIGAHVVIAGDGPERAGLMKLADDIGVSISFSGTLSQEDLVAHVHAAQVVVFPSVERSEAYGISMLEAHACGTPVIATTLGTGVEFVNAHGETGLNVQPGDPTALAGAVNRLLEDETMRTAMGARAQARAEKDFDARRIAREEYEIYRSVLHDE
jgi:O-antigen biosynthesis rhamnosyltransferase